MWVRDIPSAGEEIGAYAARRIAGGGEEPCGDSGETIDQSPDTEDISHKDWLLRSLQATRPVSGRGAWTVDPS